MLTLKYEGSGGICHRVYAFHANDTYKIYLGDNIKRVFTDETLPDAIKTTMGLINAYQWKTTGMNGDSIIWKFEPDYPEVAFEIGWRDGEHYCLVLSDKVFKQLRGVTDEDSDTVREVGNDARGQGQSEGKESSY